jgi:hypothetical protein
LLLGLCPFLNGCRSCDAVEDQLRLRDNELREARDELCRTRAYNDALQRELGAIRHVGSGKITPEFASQTYMLKSIVLGRQTGGIDEDNCPGDEALQVVIEPMDPDNHAIKAPGTALVNALEITQEGIKKPLSSWQIMPDELRKAWKTGLLTNGYFLVLPWKIFPSTEKVRVVVQFTLEDGRMFEADKDITVKLVPPAQRKPILGEPAPGPAIESPLPLPRKVEGPTLDSVKASRSKSAGKAGPTEQTSYWWQLPPTEPAAQLLPPVPR